MDHIHRQCRARFVLAAVAGALACAVLPAQAGHPSYTYEARLHERSWVPSPIQVPEARWYCNAELTVCTTRYVDQEVTVNRCRFLSRQAGMVSSFGIQGGAQLTRQELNQCNLVAPNRPKLKRPPASSASQLVPHVQLPRP